MASELLREPHNALLHLFSESTELVGFGQSAYRRRSEKTSYLLEQLFDQCLARPREVKGDTMRWKLLVGALLLGGALLWVYTSMTYIIWDGGYELTVRLSSKAGLPRSVSCQAFGRREDAEYVLENLLPPETRLWSTTADPFAGEPFSVYVPLSGRESMSGRQVRRYQFHWLVVIAVLPDKRRVGRLVEIPEGRESREVSVELP